MNLQKQFPLLVCLFFACNVFAQDNFTIHGKIALLSKSHHITIAGPGTFVIPVKEDGTFEISGKIKEPGVALIYTDSSGANSIWLEPGDYTLDCKEIRLEGSHAIQFRIPLLQGPPDAMINHGFSESLFYIRGATPEESKKKYKAFCIQYIDSVFKNFPGCKPLPEMIRISRGMIGDEAAKKYLALFSDEQKNTDSGKQLGYYFSRQEKVKTEKLFEDFRMKDVNGNDFQLSSLAGKKFILLDFWSSDCGPCRTKHIRLAELYRNYSGKGLEIVSISLDDKKKEWQAAIEKDKMSWINVSELKGWETPLAERYFIKSIPFSFLLDSTFKIVGQNMSDKQLENFLK